MKTIAPLLLAVIYTVPAAFAQTPDPGAALAQRYGLSFWDQIEQIEYTFNVQLPGRDKPVVRSWQWNPGPEPKVVRRLLKDGVEIEYLKFNPLLVKDQSPDLVKEAHGQFINDSYWLLFPFQLVWSNPVVTDAGAQLLPLGDGEAKKLTCQWPAEGGYTPGDAYDLYLGDDGLIKQWDFRKGGGDQSFLATWEDHRQLGPITVSLDHHNADGTFRLWFTDVSATLADGTTVTPQPLAEPAAAPSVKPE